MQIISIGRQSLFYGIKYENYFKMSSAEICIQHVYRVVNGDDINAGNVEYN